MNRMVNYSGPLFTLGSPDRKIMKLVKGQVNRDWDFLYEGKRVGNGITMFGSWDGKRALVVFQFEILPEFQQKGYARELCELLEQWAVSERCGYLVANSVNPGKETFWKHLGFTLRKTNTDGIETYVKRL